MADSETSEQIILQAGRARLRAARMLAAKMDFDDVATLLRALLDREIGKLFPEELKLIEQENPKAWSARRAEHQAGS